MTEIGALLDSADATEVAATVRSGAVDPVELAEAAIGRIEERNPEINAVIATCYDAAMDSARNVDRDAPFAGVPFVVKDCRARLAGVPETWGSRLMAGAVPDEDSELTKRYRAAGFVILGVTNMPEMGKMATTEPAAYGPTRNPYDLGKSPGGSSGGTGAAVASGMVPIGHGNDGGGSIRVPSAACGLFGLKPSRGRVTGHPAPTMMSYPMGIDHVLTRSVRDSAHVLDLTAGPVPGDPYEISSPARRSHRGQAQLVDAAYAMTSFRMVPSRGMHVSDPPILLTDVLDDVGAAVKLLAQEAPYVPLGGWYNPGADPHARTRPLWFRDDWVNETIAVPGSEVFLDNSAYIDSAKAFYSAEIVEPHSVYVNQMMAIPQAGPAHTDNPRFAGRDRTNTPMWLLRAMLWSGLFNDLSFPQATAIWWLNDVDGGGIRYWPYGPDQPPEEHAGNMANTALMGDNHGMFHQVNAIGPFDIGTPMVTPMAELAPAGSPDGDWVVTDHGEEVYRTPLADIRISVLWKADVYIDADHKNRLASNPLSRDDIAARFNADLEERGIDARFDPNRIDDDPDHAAMIAEHYPEARPMDALPSVFDY